MRKVKFLLIFLAVLLLIITLKFVFIGVVVFTYILKYLVIAGVITWLAYLIEKNKYKSE
jgi:hypothetical protein